MAIKDIKEKLKKVYEPIKRLEDTLNLKKEFPGYFHTWVFYTGIFILILIMLYGGYLSGWALKNDNVYVCCPENSYLDKCEIPAGAIPYLNLSNENISSLDSNIIYFGEDTIYFLKRGTCVGNRPNWIIRNFKAITWILIIIMFSFNHFLSVRDQRKIIIKRLNK